MFKVFVYGILKGRFKGQNATIKADCHDLGGFPAITKLGGDNILSGEIIEVDYQTLVDFDRIEGVPSLYTREIIEIDGHQCFVYVYVDSKSIENLPLINIWSKKQ